MKILKMFLAGTLVLLGLVSVAGAIGLDRDGTGPDPETQPGYFCRSPFDFLGSGWNEQYRFFTIELKGQCGVIQDPSKYMPGWGGGGTDWNNVEVYGVYHYENAAQNETGGETRETVRLDGQIVLDTTLRCDRNPWIDPFGAVCTVSPQPAPINNSGVAVHDPLPVSPKYLDGSLVLALREWDANKDKPDPLADWDPMGTPDGYSALTFSSPTSYQSISDAAPSFSLALNGIPPGSKVQMDWKVIVQGPEWSGDIHLSEEARWDWWPFAGPPVEAVAAAFPLTVPVNPGPFAGKPGLYRVQVKLASETWWSHWRYFWIGPPQENIPHQEQITPASALRLKAAMKKMFTAIDTKTAQRLSKPASAAKPAVLKRAAPGAAPVASKGVVSPLSSTAPSTPTLTAKSAKVVASKSLKTPVTGAVVALESLVFKPAPPEIGAPLGVTIKFKNSGKAASDPGLKYSVTCSVKSGGPACPVANATRLVSAAGIGPGRTATDTLAGTLPAQAGSYELTVAIGAGRGKSFPFNVKAKIEPQKILKKKQSVPGAVPLAVPVK